MLTYQYTDTWSRYFLGTLVSGGIYCFGVVPVFQAIGVFQANHRWVFAALFVAYIAGSALIRYVAQLSIRITESYRENAGQVRTHTPAFQPSAKPMIKPEDKNGKREQR